MAISSQRADIFHPMPPAHLVSRRHQPGWLNWASAVLVFLVLVIAVHSLETARWISPQPSLSLVLLLAVAAAIVTAWTRLHTILALLIALLFVPVIVVWQGTGLVTESELTGTMFRILAAIQSWFLNASLGRPSEGTIHFAIFLTIFIWVAGFLSTWLVLRKHNAWLAVALGGMIILFNLSNLPDKDYSSFYLFVLTAMLLIVITKLSRHSDNFKASQWSPIRTLVPITASIFCITLIGLAAASLPPALRAHQLGATLNESVPFKRSLDNFLMNFLSEVASKQPFSSNRGPSVLSFKDQVDLSDTVHYVISSKKPYYWRTRIYDTYLSTGWSNSPLTETPVSETRAGALETRSVEQPPVTFIVTSKLKTNLLLGTGEVLSYDRPVVDQVLEPRKFDLNLTSSYRDNSLPPDVSTLARTLRLARTAETGFGLKEIQDLLPDDLIVTSIGEPRYAPSESNYRLAMRNRSLTTIGIIRKSGGGDVMAVSSASVISPDQRYTVNAAIKLPPPSELSKAGETYPHTVTDYYLQLPAGFPDRVKQIASKITADSKTPYDKVIAIKQYLSQFAYEAVGDTPPDGTDATDYFLFTRKIGNCFYFATAESVMLRAVGVPSRLVAGYLPGEWDAATGTSTVRARDYHAWVEVYFPNNGWVEFEVTPTTITSGVTFVEDLMVPEDYYLYEPFDEASELFTGDDRLTETVDGGPPIGTAFLILAMLSVVFVTYRWARQFYGADYIARVYARVCFLASLGRLGPNPSQTPNEYCERLTAAIPNGAEAIKNISWIYQQSRFGCKTMLGTLEKEKLSKSWRYLYPLLLKRILKPT